MIVSHNPSECKEALARTVSPIVLDLETTGLSHTDEIVSAGILVDGIVFILFVRSVNVSVHNTERHAFCTALRPLERPDLIVIGHNLPFDLRFLRREGIRITAEIRDTLKLLRLVDQDRGREGGSQDKHPPRVDLQSPGGWTFMNYKLKPVVAQLLGIRMPYFPGNIELAPYGIHARYLACDLVGTQKLHDHLWNQLTDAQRTYYQAMVAPLVPLLLDMAETGVATDRTFVVAESQRLEDMMKHISEEHHRKHGVALGMVEDQMREWLFGQMKLPVLKKKRQGKAWVPSLDAEAIERMKVYTDVRQAKDSLVAIQNYRQAASLLVRLRSMLKHIDQHDGRIHSSFDDRQATGRLSSSYPNLQQLAKPRTIGEEVYRARNMLVPTAGYEFAVFDIGQADVRVLAHMAESFTRTTEEHLDLLRGLRLNVLESQIGSYRGRREACRNPLYRGEPVPYAVFSPTLSADMAADFADTTKDFYTEAIKRIIGRAPVDKKERNRFKTVILSVVNGQGPPSLAKALKCAKDEAKVFLEDFDRAYPKIAAYKQLMHWQIAITGQTATFMDRPRTMTAHHWMVTEPKVEVLVSYKGGQACWLEVVPLEPGLRVLTVYILRAWNGKTGRLIYHHERGRLSQRPYHLFDDQALQFLLPVRNLGWRSIRRVRAHGQEASYEGFDATARTAFNFICQGGTADVNKLMMLRGRDLCKRFGARLLIQIHDELVYEVSRCRADAFLAEMKSLLEQPPIPGFRVPIVVEAKRGMRFGELTEVQRPSVNV